MLAYVDVEDELTELDEDNNARFAWDPDAGRQLQVSVTVVDEQVAN